MQHRLIAKVLEEDRTDYPRHEGQNLFFAELDDVIEIFRPVGMYDSMGDDQRVKELNHLEIQNNVMARPNLIL